MPGLSRRRTDEHCHSRVRTVISQHDRFPAGGTHVRNRSPASHRPRPDGHRHRGWPARARPVAVVRHPPGRCGPPGHPAHGAGRRPDERLTPLRPHRQQSQQRAHERHVHGCDLPCDESAGPPDAFEATVLLSGGVALAPELPDIAPALDDNPDFNEAAGPFGSGPGWDCTAFGSPFRRAALLQVHLACNEKKLSPRVQLTANPGLLGTITMQPTGVGVETFTFTTDRAA